MSPASAVARILAARLSLALLLFLGACSCPEAPEMKRLTGFDLSTPEASLAYFRAAVTRNDPWQEYLVFSEALKDEVEEKEGHLFSIANYSYARDQVLEELTKRIGPISEVEIGDTRLLEGGLAEVEVGSNGEVATIVMILQVEYSVRIVEGDGPLEGILPPSHPAVVRREGGLGLHLPSLLPPGIDPSEVYRIEFERAWKIRGIKNSNLANELGEVLPKAPPPPES